MLILLAYIGTIFFILSALCYYQRFWYFQDVKGLKGRFSWPLIMDAMELRSPQKIIEFLLDAPKRYGHNIKGFRFSIGFNSCVVLLQKDDISAVLNSPELITKGNDYKFFVLGEGLVTSTGKKWTQRRKLLTPSFHFSILRSFVPTVEAMSDLLIEVLEKKANGEAFDASPVTGLYILDVICETSMGVSIDAQKNGYHESAVVVKKLIELTIKRTFSWWKRYEFLYKFSQDYKEKTSFFDWLCNHALNMIEERRQMITDVDDLTEDDGGKKKFALLDTLIKGEIEGKHLSDGDIREEVITSMAAGLDTTSAALAFALYCLSSHPEIQERLLKEQREILGEAGQATQRDLQKMEYLEMVIKEVMRMYPPVPFFTRTTKENVSMDFGTLKKGVEIGVCPLITHKNPEYFPDPEKFNPDRFSPENVNQIKPFTYLPFSAGYRNCIGSKLAMIALKSGVSKIVRNFKIHPVLNHKPILTFEITLRSKNGLPIIMEKRL